nr:immunoglobulin heavy chain junction region [Macaca mulatta]MOY21219.1 immunoglobulin heavy chain junction region [Macaca mulatta]MOY21239.1 immunoglobulin heavy chain junction region [Macaca mulatta]MOY21512.1 immunoglobulin heavy chain junction region [Macaca mulatta]MOY21540.1 immunoglobulin heavy chain junction region [Macaca mulatta]
CARGRYYGSAYYTFSFGLDSW